MNVNMDFYTDYVNILDGSIHAISKNTEAFVVDIKAVNAEKTKYMIMSGSQNAGWNSNIKPGSKSVETAEQFKYLETILTNQNSICKKLRAD
jgi:hypothetical protein